MLEVVENQIRDNEPPETRQTVERLIAEGFGAEEARRLVATAVVVELFHTICLPAFAPQSVHREAGP